MVMRSFLMYDEHIDDDNHVDDDDDDDDASKMMMRDVHWEQVCIHA